jgi:hypothetical protein
MKTRSLCYTLAMLAGSSLVVACSQAQAQTGAPQSATAPQSAVAPVPTGVHPPIASPYAGNSSTPVEHRPNLADGPPACPGCTGPSDTSSGLSGNNGGCAAPTCGTNSCEDCLPHYTNWARAEYLLWWSRKTSFPALFDIAPATSLATPAAAGMTGLAGQSVIFGNTPEDHGGRAGGRFTVGHYFDQDQVCGIDGSFMFFEHRAVGFAATSTGDPVLGRPINDTGVAAAAGGGGGGGPMKPTKTPTLILVAAPAPFNLIGSGAVYAPSAVWGADMNVRLRASTVFADRVHYLVGFRHFQLNEGVAISEVATINPASTAVNAGDSITRFDNFGTHNQFYGPQVGFDSVFCWRKVDFNFLTKIAIGDMHQVAHIDGFSTFTPAGIVGTTAPGGLLALPSNIGTHTRERFVWMPEVMLTLGYRFSDSIKGFIGWNYLSVSSVLRPGDQINPNVNSTHIPFLPGAVTPPTPDPSPRFGFHGTDYWMSGLTFGLQVQF